MANPKQEVKQYGNWKDFQGDIGKMNGKGWRVVAAFSSPKTMKGVFQQGVGYDVIVVYENEPA